VEALTALVELGVGVACVVLGVALARTRSASGVRVAGLLIALAGVVAAVHAVVIVAWSMTD
jgi:hypothetical protein